MNHFSLTLIAHAATIFLILKTLIQWQPEAIAQRVNQHAEDEHRLHICGGLIAGLRNLEETVAETSDPQKTLYARGFAAVQSHVEGLTTSSSLPGPDECEVAGTSGRTYRAKPYRLNEVDQPSRRINWSYSFSHQDEI